MARTAATGRTAATNRVAVQDMKASLFLSSTSSKVAPTVSPMSQMQAAYTIAIWVQVTTRVTSSSAGNIMGSSAGDKLWLNVNSGTGIIRVYHADLTPASVVTSSTNIQDGRWHHIAASYSGSSVKIYLDGALVATQAVTGTLNFTSSIFTLGQGNTTGLVGRYSSMRVYSRALTLDEINQLKNGNAPSGAIVSYPLNEGAGTTAYDTSGNGNHGTITNGTYTADVPTKKRGLVGGNLVKNGDFEYAPPVNAVGNPTSHRWIDGTLNGAAANSLFGWTYFNWAGTKQAYFDDTVKHSGSYSMKLSTLAIGSSVGVRINGLGLSALINNIPCKPNTSYTLSGWMKTQVNSGSATSGAYFVVGQANELISATAPSAATFPMINTTTDWTKYTVQFTTNATARFLVPGMQLTGTDGAGTLTMDAWFDDITLTPTVKPTRGIAG